MNLDQEYVDFFTELLGKQLVEHSFKREVDSAIIEWCTRNNYTPPRQGIKAWQHLTPLEEQCALFQLNISLLCNEQYYNSHTTSMAYPAMRLVRVAPRDKPRKNWPQRWAHACAEVGYKGCCTQEMIALTLSPVWKALSRFGLPYPPFDYDSGMGIRPVSYSEAEKLGLATNEAMQAIRKMDPNYHPSPVRNDLKSNGEARWEGNTLVWIEHTTSENNP